MMRRDIALMLEVTERTVERYTERTDFPKPRLVAGRIRIWERRDVERWAKKTLPLRAGRPPKTHDR